MVAQASISSIVMSSGVGANSYSSGVMESQYSMGGDIMNGEEKEILIGVEMVEV